MLKVGVLVNNNNSNNNNNNKKKQNGKQCRSWWDGRAVSSGPTLFAKIYILVFSPEKAG